VLPQTDNTSPIQTTPAAEIVVDVDARNPNRP
jgi:hypothetical protein